MTIEDLKRKAIELESEIHKANQRKRLKLQPQFSRVLSALAKQGGPVPARLHSLEETLREEAIEERFDNMPV